MSRARFRYGGRRRPRRKRRRPDFGRCARGDVGRRKREYGGENRQCYVRRLGRRDRGRGDGFNAAGGTDDSVEKGMFGPDAFASDATKTLTFEGGTGNLGGMREPGGMQAPDNMQQPGGRAF